MKTLEQLYQSKTFTQEEINHIRSQNIDWNYISFVQTLSEEFIEEFQDKVNWEYISANQNLSKKFIEKYQDKLKWAYISGSQKLSEEFIEKFQDKVNWSEISYSQNLSETFIHKHQDKVNWTFISEFQKLSEAFIEKHEDKINKKLIPNQTDNRSYEEKLANITAYANHYNLKLENDYLYCYRIHDQWNRGLFIFNKANSYDNPGKYSDWKCDLNPENKNSYGLGVSPEGNIYIRVHVNDWGIWVKNTDKGRVWAFEIL